MNTTLILDAEKDRPKSVSVFFPNTTASSQYRCAIFPSLAGKDGFSSFLPGKTDRCWRDGEDRFILRFRHVEEGRARTGWLEQTTLGQTDLLAIKAARILTSDDITALLEHENTPGHRVDTSGTQEELLEGLTGCDPSFSDPSLARDVRSPMDCDVPTGPRTLTEQELRGRLPE